MSGNSAIFCQREALAIPIDKLNASDDD